jgi:hypothetical protein
MLKTRTADNWYGKQMWSNCANECGSLEQVSALAPHKEQELCFENPTS